KAISFAHKNVAPIVQEHWKELQHHSKSTSQTKSGTNLRTSGLVRGSERAQNQHINESQSTKADEIIHKGTGNTICNKTLVCNNYWGDAILTKISDLFYPKHLTYKPPEGDTSVSNLSISFPTNPQPTNLAHDPSPPTPLARRPRIPSFCVLAKDDWKAISFAHKNVAPIVQEHWKELQHHSKSTSQTKSGTNLRTSGLHLTYKPPEGDSSVSNLSISFPTNPQPTNLAHDPSPLRHWHADQEFRLSAKAISFAHKNVAPIVQEHWKELQHHSKSTSQTKSGTNLRTSGLHLTYKPPEGDSSVSNLSISFPTNPQPTNLAHDPSPLRHWNADQEFRLSAKAISFAHKNVAPIVQEHWKELQHHSKSTSQTKSGTNLRTSGLVVSNQNFGFFYPKHLTYKPPEGDSSESHILCSQECRTHCTRTLERTATSLEVNKSNKVRNKFENFWFSRWGVREPKINISTKASQLKPMKYSKSNHNFGFFYPKHLTYKPPEGDTSVSNLSISFPTNPQPTNLAHDPSPLRHWNADQEFRLSAY
ncbi:hypothetical protein CEXT_695781, partial [Caerostris extrusa]